jgi:hypothetical protein
MRDDMRGPPPRPGMGPQHMDPRQRQVRTFPSFSHITPLLNGMTGHRVWLRYTPN